MIMTSAPSIFVTGCSWSRDWPALLDMPNVTHEWHDGKGLATLADSVKQNGSRFDFVVVQMPTPIRWDRSGWSSKRFIDAFLGRLEKFRFRSEESLLDEYRNQILALNKIHPRILFFFFNTGGYPFRAPFDFGEHMDVIFMESIEGMVWHQLVNFEGRPGYCLGEVPYDGQEPRAVDVVHPKGHFVTDAHPNLLACEHAATTVREEIQSHAYFKTS